MERVLIPNIPIYNTILLMGIQQAEIQKGNILLEQHDMNRPKDV